ncbi:DNA polymerase III, alpha subunit [Gemmatirosa kalamazoonensis]|uniref:DNA polymerase III subunit alpha n=1 Tax=Gemmatirosa kalamazoonensis TaxID=861299 RepID=W0RLA4_9BACT|nr:DNA polymerase III subunit alpha [Gemmatirosa kalamazoonensis]AHG90193.1 DNA polymerase III, alpha subunit [Gemmatirosa kalamazoonensis]
MSFVHLHCHSEYSLLDGANRIDDLIRRALELEQPALAVTDHGNLHAAWEFQEKAKKAKIKPILGMEAYVAPGSRLDRSRPAPGAKPYFHLVLLARDAVGYKNLVKLSSLAFTEGFYVKPRVDRELLAAHSEGLIVSSACLAGEVAGHLMDDRWDAAREAAEWYANVFKDRYYLEVQAHDSEGQAQLNERIFRLGNELGLPVIATNDAHFLKREDHDAHDVLLCIGLGADREDAKRMHYDRGLYFKTHAEIAERFPARADVLENTLRIADEVDVQFGKKYHVPSFPLPQGVATENDLLVKLARDGAVARYGDPLPKEVQERLDYELGVILQTGYSGYFLIVADFIKAARDRGIPVGPGRGSAAGSLVAYALGITNVCPLKFDLLFERFLNPERVSMPDVDVDFCFERRGEVIDYVRQKYGKESVCQIVTFGTMKSRAAIKDVGRVLGFTPAETDQLAKLIPNQPNFSLTIAEAIEQVPDVARLYKTEPRYTELLDYAKALEGLSRHTGVHAAGVVIAPGPVSDFVPVCTQSSKGAGGDGDEKITVAQYDMNCLEKAGMLKMDFLGLTTLTVIHDALKSIEARTGQWLDLDAMEFDDPKTYQMLRSGRTAGVFQFESPLATDVLRQMRCDRFDDLVASNALLRPGPLDTGMHKVYIKRKRGEEPVTYQLPEMEPILRETQGVITYQEQVMRIAQTLAGISLAEADVLRKAVGKKDAELIRQELGKFIEKAVAKGHDRVVIEDIAGQIETFGRYGFNKSHSVAYSVVSYHTAWLKANYPADFMAALLSSCIGKTEDVVKYIAEAREMGIEVLPPDVNESGYKFTVVGENRIRFGLGAVRNVGEGAVQSVLASRAEGGAYTSFFDFVERVDLRACNKRVFEALVCAGALDGLGGHRAQYLAALDTAISAASLKQDEEQRGVLSLFGEAAAADDAGSSAHKLTLPNLPAWSESDRLTREKEILGFYVSGHPLEPFRAEAEIFATHKVAELGAWTPEPITLACVVTAVKKQISKRSGAEFARLTLEDFSGSSEVLVFPEAWSALSDAVKTDVPVLVEGGYSKRDQGAESPTFIVEKVTRLAEKRVGGQVAIAIELAPGAGLAPGVMRDVRATCDAYPGSAPLELRWRDSRASARFRSRSLSVAPSNAVLAELRALLGDERVRLVRA